jgi:hypothetical protein
VEAGLGHREVVATKKKLLMGVGAFLLVCVVVLALLPNPEERRLRAPERKQWKEQALARIRAVSSDQQVISNEIASLHAEVATQTGDGWKGTNVLLMTNGEYLVYSQLCGKEDHRIHGIFIAHGSDGKWYYSTFHFCIGMVTLRGEIFGRSRVGSIAEFTQAYSAHEFDGRSDDCLKKTWPFKNWQTNLNSEPK